MTATTAATLDASYWIERTSGAERVRLTAAQIELLNRQSLLRTDSLVELESFPAALNAADLLDRLHSISHRPESGRYYDDGEQLDDDAYKRYEANLNLPAIKAGNPVRFGLVARRAAMRTYPTGDAVYKSGPYADLDRFQENGLFPADAVAVLHDSTDGAWLLVQNYNYLAWVRRAAIAMGERLAVLDYSGRADFIVVVADRITCRVDSPHGGNADLQLDMAVKLPLATPGKLNHARPERNAPAGYAVDVPTADAAGQLAFVRAVIGCDDNVSHGFLPYTQANLLRQAFRFLGEHYGWGHSRNARDCTGFVADVYRTFGILLPRNSDKQGASDIGRNLRFDENAGAERKADAVSAADTGSLIYMPGHVAMYLGEVHGEPYVIHDVARLHPSSTTDERGYQGGVAVAPLRALVFSKTTSYIDAIQSIKTIG